MLGVITIILICLLVILAISVILHVATDSDLFLVIAIVSGILVIIGVGAVAIISAYVLLI